MTVELGAEVLLKEPARLAGVRSLAFLTHHAACLGNGTASLAAVAAAFPGRVREVWSPQHGFYGVQQANMIPSPDAREPLTGLPLYSLYGDRRQPTAAMFENLDLVLVDLVDVGCRVYTYIWTLYLVLQAAARAGVPVLVLDRPNPLGGVQMTGNLLEDDYASFVGLHPLPMRHGLTVGELALYLNENAGFGCRLEVLPLRGWRRRAYLDETGVFWVPPSPNMPTLQTAMVYPGQVLLEGTNLSEGRGTTTPFELWGAPFIRPQEILAAIDRQAAAGVVLRPTWFKPTFDKWRGEVCGGLQIHVIERESFDPYFLTLELLRAVINVCGEQFSWLPPPYEYEYRRLPFDILTGTATVRHVLESDGDLSLLRGSWQEELAAFRRRCREFMLY